MFVNEYIYNNFEKKLWLSKISRDISRIYLIEKKKNCGFFLAF